MKQIICALITLTLLLVFPPFLFSQTTTQYSKIHGIVRNSNQKPLAGAIITTSKGTTIITNSKGEYNLKSKIIEGEYIVSASYLGFSNKKEHIFLHKGSNIELNFILNEASTKLHEVIVVSESEKHKIETDGFTVNSIDIKKNKNSSLTVSELLDRSSGIKIRQAGGLGSHLKFNINGLSGNSVRIFVNGIPAENYGQGFSINNIPSSMIKRIDVYKGVVPASFGSDALGGAVNIVLNESRLNEINASYSFGSFNTHQTSLNGVYNNDSTGFTVRGGMFTNYSNNNYDVWGRMVYVTKPNGQIEYVRAKRFHDKFKQIGANFSTGFTNVPWADHFLIGANLSTIKKAEIEKRNNIVPLTANILDIIEVG